MCKKFEYVLIFWEGRGEGRKKGQILTGKLSFLIFPPKISILIPGVEANILFQN